MATDVHVKERPILFSAPMVRAILEGRKTQTRRVVKPQPKHRIIEGMGHITIGMDPADDGCVWYDADGKQPGQEVRCPYGRIGDRLWVRETWGLTAVDDTPPFSAGDVLRGEASIVMSHYQTRVHYRATELRDDMMWRPSIHMPRCASRITLEVTGVRAERLHGISETDALAEGFKKLPASGRVVLEQGGQYFGNCWQTARSAFHNLWDSINGKRGCSWDTDPWVWVVEFERLE